MNSLYHCIIYAGNVIMVRPKHCFHGLDFIIFFGIIRFWQLFWTDDVVDILLNALAIEFVKDLDEVITSMGWCKLAWILSPQTLCAH